MNCVLSIIIPHYNSADGLRRLLRSVGQHDNVQIIVVDDHSDREREKFDECARDFAGDNCLFVNNPTDKKGAGAARNTGLDLAAGRWLLFADADDYLTDGWYESVSRYFESEYDLIYFRSTSFDVAKQSVGKRHEKYVGRIDAYQCGGNNAENYLRYYYSVPWSKLIRHDVVLTNKIRFDEVMFSNDVMFSAKVGFYAKKITTDNDTIYCVVEDSSTLTKNSSEAAYFTRTVVSCELFKFLKEKLPAAEYAQLDKTMPTKRMLTVLRRGYGLRAAGKYAKLFRSCGLKLLPIKDILKYGL